MYYDPEKNCYCFHVLPGAEREYLFDPEKLQISRITTSEAEVLGMVERDPMTRFVLHETDAFSRFAAPDFCPDYELNILPTAACNLQCGYCFTRDTYRSSAVLDPTLAKILIEGIIQHYRLKFVKFFGGEPLLQFDMLMHLTDFTEDRCAALGRTRPSLGVVTNGLLLDPTKASFLKHRGFCLTISCDGITVAPELSTIRMGRTSTHMELLDRLRLALDLGLNPSVQATYTKRHVADGISPLYLLEDFRQFGIEACHIMPAFGDLDGLSEYELAWVCRGFHDAAVASVRSILNGRPAVLLYVLKVVSRLLGISEGHFLCGAGIDSLTLMPSGKIYPCYLLYDKRLVIGDLNNQTFEELIPALQSTRAQFIDNRKQHLDPCIHCWGRTVCASCFGPRFRTDRVLGAPGRAFCRTILATIDGSLSALAALKTNESAWDKFVNRFCNFLAVSGQPILNIEQRSSK